MLTSMKFLGGSDGGTRTHIPLAGVSGLKPDVSASFTTSPFKKMRVGAGRRTLVAGLPTRRFYHLSYSHHIGPGHLPSLLDTSSAGAQGTKSFDTVPGLPYDGR